MKARRNIMSVPDEEQIKLYEEIHQLYLKGIQPVIKEHRSGFPAITVDCGDIHIITDCISLEQWWLKKKANV